MSWLSSDKVHVKELAGRRNGGLLLLEASHVLYFLFSWEPKIIDLRAASLRPLPYGNQGSGESFHGLGTLVFRGPMYK